MAKSNPTQDGILFEMEELKSWLREITRSRAALLPREMKPAALASLNLVYGFALLLFLAAGVMAVVTMSRTAAADRRIARGVETHEKLRAIGSDLTAVESARLAYLNAALNDEPDSFAVAEARLRRDMDALRQLISADPDQLPRFETLQSAVNAALQLNVRSIDLKMNDPGNGSAKGTLSSEAITLMSSTLGMLQQMEAESLRSPEREVSATSTSRVMRIFIFASLIGILLAVSATVVLNLQSSAYQRAGELLRASENRYRLLSAGVKALPVCLLDPEGRIRSWNDELERVLGYQRHEVLGRPISCLFVPQDVETQQPRLALEAAAREGLYRREARLVRHGGATVEAALALTSQRGDTGELIGYCLTVASRASEPNQDK